MAKVSVIIPTHNRWQLLTDGLFKLAMTLLAGYALYLLVGKT